jgi:hypothetical protein
VCDQNIAEARSIFRTSSSDRSETSPTGRRDARTRLRDLRRVHRVRLVAALDLACIERDRGPDVTGHDDQHLMWGALIRRSVVCCTPAPAPAPLSLRDDRVEGATELTAVGGPRVRISLPPAASQERTSHRVTRRNVKVRIHLSPAASQERTSHRVTRRNVTLGNPTLTSELKERLAAGITAETAGRGIAELARPLPRRSAGAEGRTEIQGTK